MTGYDQSTKISTTPKTGSHKINPKTLSHFSPQKNCLLQHHLHHAKHHNDTTKTPRQNTLFFQKPQQSTTNPPAKKNTQTANQTSGLGIPSTW
ncbi:hypothetical protein [Tunturiibacter gelidiferens]|uniref:hypothetical protein n=1 Tax=Tunturiibacter gelidiferens TaxID=3069689 RepID=UPI003D9B2E7F